MSAGPPVRVVATALWLLVAAGPVLGGAALLRPVPTTAATAPDDASAAVTGFAEVTVVAHLVAPPGTTPAPLSPAHPALRPLGHPLDGLSTTERATAGAAVAVPVQAAAAVAATPAGPGRWGVVVAVVRNGSLEAWQVTVAETADGVLAETLPAPVGLPEATAPPVPATTALQVPDADDPLTVAVQRFLDALLVGEGELQRYVSAHADIRLPAPRRARAELTRLSTGPVDGGRLAVLAEARTVGTDGAVHLVQYPLLMQRGGGRWEVVRLLPALPVQTSTDDEGNPR